MALFDSVSIRAGFFAKSRDLSYKCSRNLKEEPRHQESAELIEQQKRFVIFGRVKPPVRGGTVPTMNGHGNQAEAGDRIAETETSSSSI